MSSKLLFSPSRRRIVQPERLLKPFVSFVRELGDAVLAIGVQQPDERWQRAGAALHRAAELLADAVR